MNAHHYPHLRRLGLVSCAILTPLLLIMAVLIANQSLASASSHREAPLISKDAFADNTDTYLFISPENQNNVVLVGSWIPFEGPEGGPNYFEWDDSALYDIYVDNDGDAKADITYTLSSKVQLKTQATFLYNIGKIAGLNDPNWNRQQLITVTETTEGGGSTVLVGNKSTAPVNIGEKSTPNYATLSDAAIYTFNTPQGTMKIFGGQTDDAFWVDLQVFDLLTLRGQNPPVGYTTGTNVPVDSVSGFNVHSLVIEAPIAHVTNGTEPVIGVWAATRRATTRVLGALGSQTNSMTYTQVSRLGMPLVNEVVVPLALKDAFNNLQPQSDLDVYTHPTFGPILQKSVEDPEIGTLLCTLYGVPIPNAINPASSDPAQKCHTKMTVGTPRSGRGDIFDIFLTGIRLPKALTIGATTIPAGTYFTQPQNVRPAEMIRLNTAIHTLGVCPATPHRLGVLGGDLCGFPNGRRLTDDIVEIELAAVAGAVYELLDDRDPNFQFNSDFLAVLDDGIDYNDVPYYKNAQVSELPDTFPYLGMAQSGQSHWHTNPFFNILIPWVMKD